MFFEVCFRGALRTLRSVSFLISEKVKMIFLVGFFLGSPSWLLDYANLGFNLLFQLSNICLDDWSFWFDREKNVSISQHYSLLMAICLLLFRSVWLGLTIADYAIVLFLIVYVFWWNQGYASLWIIFSVTLSPTMIACVRRPSTYTIWWFSSAFLAIFDTLPITYLFIHLLPILLQSMKIRSSLSGWRYTVVLNLAVFACFCVMNSAGTSSLLWGPEFNKFSVSGEENTI